MMKLGLGFHWLLVAVICLSACGDDDGGDDVIDRVDTGPPPPPPGQDAGVTFELEPMFLSETVEGCTYASPVEVESQEDTAIVGVGHRGNLIAVDPESGITRWRYQFEAIDDGNFLDLLSTPAVFDNGTKALFGWQELMPERRRIRHVVAVLDLETRELDPEYELLELSGSLPAYNEDGEQEGTVDFESRWQLMRSELMILPAENTELGLAYVSLGNGPSEQPFHGWVFEVDLDAWKAGSADDAIINLLVSTQENDCGSLGNRDPMICGGGVWTAAGPEPYFHEDGTYELLVPTGNGRVDMERHAFAHSVMRVERGLAFESGCDESVCLPFDELDPDPACLATCQDVFIARETEDSRLPRPNNESCDGKTFQECYGVLDADLGSSAPVVVDVPEGPRVVVQPGKDGAVYLVDHEHLGTLYQRLQVMDSCGTDDDVCQAYWIGTFVTHPVVAEFEGDPIVIVASVMADRTHPSGVTALRITMQGDEPHMEVFWQVPDFSSEDATRMFRHHPGRPILADVGGESFVFVVETRRATSGDVARPPGILWGIRVSDGFPMVQQPIENAGQRFAIPLIVDDRIYISSCDPRGEAEGQVLGYRIVRQ